MGASAVRRPLLLSGGAARRGYAASAHSFAHCVRQVHDLDYERYACDIYLPKDARPVAFAVHAFNIEVARIRDAVRDTTLRRTRMQWWRESLQSAGRGLPAKNPVLECVAHAVHKTTLVEHWLHKLIDARERDLEMTSQPEKMAWVEAYADETAGSMVHAVLEASGITDDEAHDAAAQVGRAYGLVTLLRGTPHHIARGLTYLPQEVTSSHNVRLGDLAAGRHTPELGTAVAAMATRADGAATAAEQALRRLPRSARLAMAPLWCAQLYLRDLARAGHNIFDPGLATQQRLRLNAFLAWKLRFGLI